MASPHRALDAIDLHVAARIRARRLQLGLQAPLVDASIGEPGGTIEKVEAGERRIGAAALYRLCQALNVDISYFFEGLRPSPAETSPVTTVADAPAFDVNAAPPNDPISADSRAIAEAQRFVDAFSALPSDALRARVRSLIKILAVGKNRD